MIRLIPDGEFDAPRGSMAGRGPWRLTPESAARVIAANRTRSADILIDFEHQALLSEHNGRPVIAAGWVDPRSLEYRPDGEEPGLYGAVTWAGDTAAMIAADQYRYLSPVFPADARTGEPLDLLHVALTNFPAIDEPLYAALSARYPRTVQSQETSVNETLKKLLAALGLPEATSEDDAVAGVVALKAKADQAGTLQTEVAALKAAGPAAPDPAKFVPVETMKTLQIEIAALSARLNGNEMAQLVESALACGKLLPAQKDWAESLGKTNLAALKAYIDTAQPIAALAGMQSNGRKPDEGGTAAATDADLAVCKALGLTPEEYAKGKLEK
jgi:phage I-like protein